MGIQTQNGLADLIPGLLRVGEQVDPVARGSYPIRTVVGVHADWGKLSNRNRIFRDPIAEEVAGIAFAEGLAAAVGGSQSDWQAAASGEYRGKCPAAQEMPGEAVLPLIP